MTTHYGDSSPNKNLFINLLTKDIQIVNCILDLLDNSVDGIIQKSNFDALRYLKGELPDVPLSGYKITITLSKDIFSISDNGCGISIENAENKVFKLGSALSDEDESTNYGLSVYGIGMKRAFFKLGNLIKLYSVTEDSKIDLGNGFNIDSWKQDAENWKIPFNSEGNLDASNTGTRIEVSELRENFINAIVGGSIIKSLAEKISKCFSLFMKAGLVIVLNDEQLGFNDFKLSYQDTNLTPSNFETKLNNNDTDVLILTGITPRDIGAEYGGWYILCNGRVILAGDKTRDTGWGVHYRQFHSTLNHFIGIVYFHSKKLTSLPWNTSKDGVDVDSTIYQETLPIMAREAEPVIRFLNEMYGKQSYIEEPEVENLSNRELIDKASSISINEIVKQGSKAFVAKPEGKKENQTVNIMYKKTIGEVELVKELLGDKKMSNKDVGEKTFQYFIDNEN